MGSLGLALLILAVVSRARTRRGKSGVQRPDRGQRHAYRGHELRRLYRAWPEALRERDLNCAGFTITGPDGAQPNGASTGHYGLRASNVGGIKVDCNVTGYERGLYFSSVHDGFVKAATSTEIRDTSQPRQQLLRFALRLHTYSSNGDEGVHSAAR